MPVALKSIIQKLLELLEMQCVCVLEREKQSSFCELRRLMAFGKKPQSGCEGMRVFSRQQGSEDCVWGLHGVIPNDVGLWHAKMHKICD